MNYKIRIISLFIIVLTNSGFTKGQELRGISENAEIKKFLKLSKKFLIKDTDDPVQTTSFPFFDDFSNRIYDESVFPDGSKWADNYAFINNSYPVNPISIGVATLDAIDDEGNVYPLNSYPTIADRLTSDAFNLDGHNPSDTIYLSFYYQAGGLGEPPDSVDRLAVDFYSVRDNKWIEAWTTPGHITEPFKQVIIPVHDSLYQDGFQFRFYNYVSISAKDIKGGDAAISNIDMWHIDYVRLENTTKENHSKLVDVAMMQPLHPIHKYYEAIPWDHLNYTVFDGRNSDNRIKFRVGYPDIVNDPIDPTVHVSRYFMIKDLNTNTVVAPPVEYSDDYVPLNIYTRKNTLIAYISYNSNFKKGRFEIRSYMTTENDDFCKENDTVRRIEEYSNYYAYDDGTSEYGFGFTHNAYDAILVQRFKLFRSDTLSAIDIYFNKTLNDANKNLGFQICAWSNYKSKPHELLYLSKDVPLSELFTPNANSGYGEFSRYILNNKIIVSDTVYVGIIQKSNGFLNIGYSINSYDTNLYDHTKDIFYNNEGDWVNMNSLTPKGSLMIRPVFGNDIITSLHDISYDSGHSIRIFPCPATDNLNIHINGIKNTDEIELRFYDITGRMLYFIGYDAQPIDISGLNNGYYLLNITNGSNLFKTEKIIISR